MVLGVVDTITIISLVTSMLTRNQIGAKNSLVVIQHYFSKVSQVFHVILLFFLSLPPETDATSAETLIN